MLVTVQKDFVFLVGGPAEDKKTPLICCKAGEKLTIKRVSKDGDYPAMFVILEHPKVGMFSLRVLLALASLPP